MRLLHTERLEFDEFFDDNIPPYVILSHRWGSVKEEVSYHDFISGKKQATSGYDKLMQFRWLVRRKGFAYCWMVSMPLQERDQKHDWGRLKPAGACAETLANNLVVLA